MCKIRSMITWWNSIQSKSIFIQHVFLEFQSRFQLRFICYRMPIHIQSRRGNKFRGGITLVESSRLFDFIHQSLWHRLFGLIVNCVVFQDFRFQSKEFVDLRREFHKISRRIRSRNGNVLLISKKSVQSMSKFVEHGGNIVIRNQRRFSFRRFLIIENIHDHRFLTQKMRLLHKVAHPSATIFIVSGVEIKIINCQRFSVSVENFISHHIWMIHRQIFSFFKSDSVKFFRSIENPFFQHGRHFKIRLDLIFIQVIFFLSNLFCIEIPIPWFNGKSTFLLVD